jgi:hypothetical protein
VGAGTEGDPRIRSKPSDPPRKSSECRTPTQQWRLPVFILREPRGDRSAELHAISAVRVAHLAGRDRQDAWRTGPTTRTRVGPTPLSARHGTYYSCWYQGWGGAGRPVDRHCHELRHGGRDGGIAAAARACRIRQTPQRADVPASACMLAACVV